MLSALKMTECYCIIWTKVLRVCKLVSVLSWFYKFDFCAELYICTNLNFRKMTKPGRITNGRLSLWWDSPFSHFLLLSLCNKSSLGEFYKTKHGEYQRYDTEKKLRENLTVFRPLQTNEVENFTFAEKIPWKGSFF